MQQPYNVVAHSLLSYFFQSNPYQGCPSMRITEVVASGSRWIRWGALSTHFPPLFLLLLLELKIEKRVRVEEELWRGEESGLKLLQGVEGAETGASSGKGGLALGIRSLGLALNPPIFSQI